MQYSLATLKNSVFVTFFLWISSPVLTGIFVAWLNNRNSLIPIVLFIGSWAFFGGFFISHWRCRIPLRFVPTGLIYREPGDFQCFGFVDEVVFPIESIRDVKWAKHSFAEGGDLFELNVHAVPCGRIGEAYCTEGGFVETTNLDGTKRIEFRSQLWVWNDDGVDALKRSIDGLGLAK